MSPTQGQAIFLWGYSFPAIYFPSLARTVTVGSRCLKARLYGWLPLSDASGIYPCLCIPFVMLPLFPQGVALGWWLIAPFRGVFVRTIIAVGHYKYPRSIHPDFKFGWTKFCQIIFEFWPQKMGGIGHERVTRSKKRQFLRFLVNRWLTDDYTDV